MDLLTGLTTLAADVPDPAGLLPARQQMALSLGWHIVLACFGVAFPTMILVMHWRGVYRDDPLALVLARRWAKVSAVLFAIGAVSGTVLSFEMGLLWPGLMGRFGDVLGLPFAFEGVAFFLEAIFLGIYLYGWGRIPPRRHLLMLVPMALTGIAGTFSVLAVNGWMNNPTGFRIVDGEVTDVDPWAAMFNSGVLWQFLHMWVAAFMVAGFSIAAVYAAGMLRGRRDRHHRLGFTVPFAFASVAALLQPAIGHLLGGAGAVESIFCILALRDQIVPPTLNLDDPDEGTEGVDLVPHTAKKREVNAVLNNSFGFGGTNASLVMRKID